MAEPHLPLSFPTILQNPALAGYLQERSSNPTYVVKKHPKNLRLLDEVLDAILARFAGNPHIVTASQHDYALQPPRTLPTFPEPLPPYIPRNARLPTSVIPARDPNSANAGRFSMSLKGMRRELRKSGFRTEVLVRDIESEVVNWLQAGGTVLAPDAFESAGTLDLELATAVGQTGTIFEISRTPLRLIWYIVDDAFARYIVHCCARYHEIVSFSKEISGQRFTYLLRPNVLYPDHHAPDGINTPPMTDADYSSQLDTESDRGSLGIDSDVEQHPMDIDGPLSTISESDVSTSPAVAMEASSTIENVDVELESDGGLATGLNALSLLPDTVSELPNIHAPRIGSRFDRQSSLHRRVRGQHRQQERSTSSPSRSPAPKSCYRGLQPRTHHTKTYFSSPHHQTLYDYLFS